VSDANSEFDTALALVLAAHKKWLDTGGTEGTRLVFPPGTNLCDADFSGVTLSNNAPLGIILTRAIQRRKNELNHT
jgi:hypothetical protein